jgi:acetoin utilization deacetylase AcuC-like enzyme
VFREVGFPVLRQFAPELLLVSAGFDAHADDPLGGMRLSAAEFVRLSAAIGAIADECCKGRVVALTEGGYDLKALADCTRAVGLTLGGDAPDVPAAGGDTARAAATCAAVVPGLRKYWKL